jgi:hypothetical protein
MHNFIINFYNNVQDILIKLNILLYYLLIYKINLLILYSKNCIKKRLIKYIV